MNKMLHRGGCTLLSCLLGIAVLASCDSRLDILPKGQSTLSTVDDLEMLFNNNLALGAPYTDLGLVCNETLGQALNVPTELAQPGTLNYALLAWDESVDRAALTLTDDRYQAGYKYINYMNTVIEKAPTATGSEQKKAQLVAEAHVMRAYLHWLLVNIYARQYDEATAETDGGIPYVTDLNLTETKPKVSVAEVYRHILTDCSDEYINALPAANTDVLRGDQAWGHAVRAKVLMQMKRYADALPYARRAVELRPEVEDRSSILTSLDYVNQRQSVNNLLYAGTHLFTCTISPETAIRFERGDYVKDYAFANGQTSMGGSEDDEDDDGGNGGEENDWDEEDWAKATVFVHEAKARVMGRGTEVDDGVEGNPEGEGTNGGDEAGDDADPDAEPDAYTPVNAANPSWSGLYGMMMSGVSGAQMYFSMLSYVNSYGITTGRMYYTLAECLIRTGSVGEGMGLVNKVRRARIHPDCYADRTADREAEAMTALQDAKWVECIGTYENFFDCRRWNTEAAYRHTITRTIMDMEGGIQEFTLAPDSKLWVFPFPQNAVRKNNTLIQNY